MNNTVIVNENVWMEVTEGNMIEAIHLDGFGWFMTAKSLVAGMYIARDVEGFDTYLDNNFIYELHKQILVDTLNKDGDLNLMHWMSGGNAFWNSDFSETVYCNVFEDEEWDDEYKEKVWDNLDLLPMENSIQEQLKDKFEGDVLDLINDSEDFTTLLKGLKDMQDEIRQETHELIYPEMVEAINNMEIVEG